jgi:hypothetical protein
MATQEYVDKWAVIDLSQEKLEFDITTDKATAEKWYRAWFEGRNKDFEKYMAEGQIEVSAQYAQSYPIHQGQVLSGDLVVGAQVTFHEDTCPMDSCQDWIAGNHTGTVQLLGGEEECRTAMAETQPLIPAWIYPKYL